MGKRTSWRVGLTLVMLILALQVGLAGLGSVKTVNAEGTAMPPKIETGMQYTLINKGKLEYSLVIDKEQLPEAVRGFKQVGRVISYNPTDTSEEALSRLLGYVSTPQTYTGPQTIIFPELPGERFITTVLYDAMGKAIGYHTQSIRIVIQYPFTDIQNDHWAFMAINEMTERKWLEGYSDGTFQPDRVVTRAEFAKIMVLAAGLKTETIEIPSFEDISSSDWYTPYIEAAMPYLTGYLQPNGNLAYKPNDPALREDIAIGVMKMIGESKDGQLTTAGTIGMNFADTNAISEVAKKYVTAAVDQGILSGFPDGTFRPLEPITRAQAASILFRAVPKFLLVKDANGIVISPTVLGEVALTSQTYKISNDTLRVKNVPYDKGYDIVVNMKGAINDYDITYVLDGKFDRLSAQLGLSQILPGETAAVKFELIGDGRQLYASGEITSAQFAPLDVDVKGVKKLVVRVMPRTLGNSGMSAILRQAILTESKKQ